MKDNKQWMLELEALEIITDCLSKLDADAQRRILRYLWDKFVDAQKASDHA
jgi:hypothetical protein